MVDFFVSTSGIQAQASPGLYAFNLSDVPALIVQRTFPEPSRKVAFTTLPQKAIYVWSPNEWRASGDDFLCPVDRQSGPGRWVRVAAELIGFPNYYSSSVGILAQSDPTLFAFRMSNADALLNQRTYPAPPRPIAMLSATAPSNDVFAWLEGETKDDGRDFLRPRDRSGTFGRWVRVVGGATDPASALLDNPAFVYGDGRQLVCDTNVNASGGFVDSWVDNLAGSWGQAATARPAHSLGTGPNGLNEVIADGVNDNLILTGLDFPAPSVGAPIYICTVFRHVATTAGPRLFGSSNDRLILYSPTGNNTWTMFDGANGPAITVPANQYCFLELLFTGSASDFATMNGGAPVPGNASNLDPAANFAIFANTGGGFTNAAIGLIYFRQNAAGAGTNAERNRVRAHVNAKWNLSVPML